MMDQAERLRQIVKEKAAIDSQINHSGARVITVTSGKGGVGKTNFTVNLAIKFRQQGQRVIIIDADFGLANIEVLFGVIPQYTFLEVVNGEKSVAEVMTKGPSGISFISGGSGIKELVDIHPLKLKNLIENFALLDTMADIILIDTGAGISSTVVNFVKASNEAIVVTTPEPTSITDAYATIKTVKIECQNTQMPNLKIVTNRVDDEMEGEDVFKKLQSVSARFLNLSLDNLGSLPYDHYLVKAVKRQEPVALSYPSCPFVKYMEVISNRLMHVEPPAIDKPMGISTFMKRLVGIFNN